MQNSVEFTKSSVDFGTSKTELFIIFIELKQSNNTMSESPRNELRVQFFQSQGFSRKKALEVLETNRSRSNSIDVKTCPAAAALTLDNPASEATSTIESTATLANANFKPIGPFVNKMELLLANQDAKYGTNMCDSMTPQDHLRVKYMVEASGCSRTEAKLKIFKEKFQHFNLFSKYDQIIEKKNAISSPTLKKVQSMPIVPIRLDSWSDDEVTPALLKSQSVPNLPTELLQYREKQELETSSQDSETCETSSLLTTKHKIFHNTAAGLNSPNSIMDGCYSPASSYSCSPVSTPPRVNSPSPRMKVLFRNDQNNHGEVVKPPVYPKNKAAVMLQRFYSVGHSMEL